MGDKMALEMQGQAPLNPEEQLLVAKALDTMKNNTTFETALVAVAEEHLNTATATLQSAETAIDAAKVDIAAKASALNMIEGISTIAGNTKATVGEISTIVNAISKSSVIKSIQRGSINVAVANNTNVTVNEVNTGKSILNVSNKNGFAYWGSNAGSSVIAAGEIINATTLSFHAGTAYQVSNVGVVTVYWELIEYV